MRELSLFTGSGGGLIATSIFLGIQTIGMVEYNEYCQKVLQKRQSENMLDQCPIFGDIREFIKQGFAESYKGMVDIITGGFPCQPFSASGLRRAQEDPRNMWPSTKETIRIIQPRFLFLENVSNLLTFAYTQSIFGSLAEMGYDAKWSLLSAKDIGSYIKRDRIWIFAEKNGSSIN